MTHFLPPLPPAPRLIGRALQLETLQQHLDAVRGGHGRSVLISGEAGIGKSRLLHAFCANPAAQPLPILRAACTEHDQPLQLAPLRAALRRLPDWPPATSLPPHLAAALAEFLPDLSPPHPESPTPAAAPELRRLRQFEALAHLLAQRAASGPLLLVVEDLHWADETSLQFLHFLARRLPALPILLLLSVRTRAETPPLARFLLQLNRERLAREIHLAPLSVDAVDALLRALFGWEQPLKRPLLTAITDLTEGNPFFVEEVAGALVANGDIVRENGRWRVRAQARLHIPRSLQLLVQERTRALTPAAADLLALAAVAGRTFDFELLLALTPHDETTLLALIAELVAAGLVVEETADAFAFRHALTRQAVYESQLVRTRRRQHAAIAAHYTALPDAAPRHLPQIAHHAFHAAHWAEALRCGAQAAADALQQFAPHAALAHLANAAEAAAQLRQPLPPALLAQRGRAHRLVGHFAAALADFEALHAAARAAGDATAEWEALHELGYLWLMRDYAQAGPLLRQALALARTLDDPTRLARSLNRLGNWQANVGRPLPALDLHAEALALCEAQDDAHGIAATLDLIATAHGLTGNVAASTAYYRRAVPRFEALGDRQAVASSLMMLTTTGDVAAGERALAITRDVGWRDGEAYAHVRLGMAHLFRGDLAQALPQLAAGLAIAAEIDHTPWQTAAHLGLGVAYLYTLALDAAAPHLQQALALAQASGVTAWRLSCISQLVQLHILDGQLAAAAALLAEQPQPPPRLETLGDRFLLYAQAALALAQGQPRQALALVAAVDTAVPDLAAWQDPTLPLLRLVQGQALRAAGQPEAAVAALAEATSLAGTSGLRPLLWRCHAARAAAHLARDDRAAAEAALEAAKEQIASLAAAIPDAARRAHFAQAAAALLPDLPPLTTLQARKLAYDGLTRRERQIAALIAQGKSNPEIADELVIAVRTVKSHVTNILNKLNMSARTQIAAWAAEKGLLP